MHGVFFSLLKGTASLLGRVRSIISIQQLARYTEELMESCSSIEPLFLQLKAHDCVYKLLNNSCLVPLSVGQIVNPGSFPSVLMPAPPVPVTGD